jgi:ribosome hibernation promoting factor
MRIDVKGRNLPVSEELREHVAKRFRKVERQVSELAELEVEVREERNPSIADSEVAEATLHLKGATLRASAASPDMMHSVNLVSEELARQVKRNRDKRRDRRGARAAAAGPPGTEPPVLNGELVLEGDVVLEAEVIPSPEGLPPDVSSAG